MYRKEEISCSHAFQYTDLWSKESVPTTLSRFPNQGNMFDRGLGYVWRTILVQFGNPWMGPLAWQKRQTEKPKPTWQSYSWLQQIYTLRHWLQILCLTQNLTTPDSKKKADKEIIKCWLRNYKMSLWLSCSLRSSMNIKRMLALDYPWILNTYWFEIIHEYQMHVIWGLLMRIKYILPGDYPWKSNACQLEIINEY